MFERYTERARRAVFFARYEASISGSRFIESHHLLLAILRQDPGCAQRVLESGETVSDLRIHFAQEFPAKPTNKSVDLPLSHECKRILAYGAEEAERLGHAVIAPHHLLLGMMREEQSAAGRLLRERGLNLAELRTQPPGLEPGNFSKQDLHRMIDDLADEAVERAGHMLTQMHITPQTPEPASPPADPFFALYTDKARRVIFFARYEASEYGSASIRSEHLLLGLLREDRALLLRLIADPKRIAELPVEIQKRVPPGPKISTSVDLPLDDPSRRILAFAKEESEALGHGHIGTEHLLLGILRESDCLAGAFLTAQGLQLDRVRDELRKQR
jgi:ATP-dependent Clp protease ATP-binding subunit ClpA